MTLFHRRLLYILFFAIFFSVAPFVIKFAEGYRYDWTKHRWQKTGVLFLESKPTKAEVYLNGKLQKKTTTAHFKYLLPDEYQVELKKDGYQSWSKKLGVFPGATTFTQYVRLFKSQPEIKQILASKITAVSETQSNFFAFVFEQEGKINLALLDLTTGKITNLTALNFLPDKIILSPRVATILLLKDGRYFSLSVASQKLTDLNLPALLPANEFKWFADQNEDFIFGNTSNGLVRFDLSNKKTTLLLEKNIVDFYLVGNDLFFLEKSTAQTLLKKTSLGSNNFQTIATLPTGKNYLFLNSPQNQLTLLDIGRQILYLVNPRADQTKEAVISLADIKFARWVNDESVLMFGNDFEIYNYYPEKKETNLVVRLSSPITKTLWYALSTHLIYLSEDKINIVETINYERAQNQLLEKTGVREIFINDKGDKIYLLAEDGVSEAVIQ